MQKFLVGMVGPGEIIIMCSNCSCRAAAFSVANSRGVSFPVDGLGTEGRPHHGRDALHYRRLPVRRQQRLSDSVAHPAPCAQPSFGARFPLVLLPSVFVLGAHGCQNPDEFSMNVGVCAVCMQRDSCIFIALHTGFRFGMHRSISRFVCLSEFVFDR